LFDKHIHNIRNCVEGNGISEYSLEFLENLVKGLNNSVARRVFTDSIYQLKSKLISNVNNSNNINSFLENRFKTIIESHVEQIDKVMKESFDAMECLSNIEFGMLKNKFTDKIPDKTKKQKLLKYEECNVEDIKAKVITDRYKQLKQSITLYLDNEL